MKKNIVVMSDTCSSIGVKEGKDKGIIINPLYVNLNEIMYEDTVQISAETFYKRIKEEKIKPSTSQPNIASVRENYNKYKDSIIINISPSEGLSGTFNGANVAIEGQKDIYVVDSKTIAAAQRFLVLKAKKLVDEGYELEEILNKLEESKKNTKAFMIPVDHAFLQRGGRLSKAAALLLGMLRIKPILTLSPDRNKVDRFAFSLTMKKAVEICIREMHKDNVNEDYKVYVMHGNDLVIANFAKNKLLTEFPFLDLEIIMLPPVLGCHAGPGTLVIQYIKK